MDIVRVNTLNLMASKRKRITLTVGTKQEIENGERDAEITTIYNGGDL